LAYKHIFSHKLPLLPIVCRLAYPCRKSCKRNKFIKYPKNASEAFSYTNSVFPDTTVNCKIIIISHDLSPSLKRGIFCSVVVVSRRFTVFVFIFRLFGEVRNDVAAHCAISPSSCYVLLRPPHQPVLSNPQSLLFL